MKLSRTKIAQLPKLKTQCLRKLDHNNNGGTNETNRPPPPAFTTNPTIIFKTGPQLYTKACITMVWAILSRWRITAKVAQ